LAITWNGARGCGRFVGFCFIGWVANLDWRPSWARAFPQGKMILADHKMRAAFAKIVKTPNFFSLPH